MSIPDVERRNAAPVMVPALVRPKVAAKAEAREVLGFCGVTQSKNGRSAVRAAKKEEGNDRGNCVMKVLKSEGEDSCGDLYDLSYALGRSTWGIIRTLV